MWPAAKQKFTPAEFLEYCRQCVGHLNWEPDMVVLHNTAAPNLAQYAKSGGKKRMDSLENYYKGKGWKGGPHLFIGPDGIWLFNPLQHRGTHSPTWNGRAFGVEMVGDYDVDEFNSGKGLLVQRAAIEAIAILCYVFDIQTADIKLHKEDPETTHACPGKKVVKADFVAAVKKRKVELMGGKA